MACKVSKRKENNNHIWGRAPFSILTDNFQPIKTAAKLQLQGVAEAYVSGDVIRKDLVAVITSPLLNDRPLLVQ